MKTLPLILIVTAFILASWIFAGKESTIISFRYGGYSDTIFALLNGRISQQQQGKLIPVANAKIYTEQNGKTVYTNSDGHFLIGLEKGSFSFIVSKNSFEPLHITNFISYPDQVSDIEIELEKGIMLRTYKLPGRQGN